MALLTRELAAAGPRHTAAARGVLPRVAYALALDPSQKFGSMEEQIVLLAERFRADGSLFVPLFICDPSAATTQFHDRGIDAHCLDLQRLSWGTLQSLRRILQGQAIDLVHWNFVAPLANPYVWALSAAMPRVRHWFTDHNSRLFPLQPPPRGVNKLAKQILLRRYGRVVCVSHYVQECLTAQAVWPNLVNLLHFINTDRFCPDESERKRLRGAMNLGNEFVLLAVGQLIREKGIDVAVRALAELPANVVLWIIGGGPQEASLRQLIDNLGLQNRARLLGLQKHVQPYLQAADCFVCPSLWGEAAGLVNIEAQACGTPVIASRIGGIPEYVADGKTGLLFAPGDHHELANCVRRLSADPELRHDFGRAARAHAVAQFSQNARLDEWLDLYRHWRD